MLDNPFQFNEHSDRDPTKVVVKEAGLGLRLVAIPFLLAKRSMRT